MNTRNTRNHPTELYLGGSMMDGWMSGWMGGWVECVKGGDPPPQCVMVRVVGNYLWLILDV